MTRLIGLFSLLSVLVIAFPAAQAQPFRHVQTLTASDAEPGDLFGTLVDLDGEVAIVRSRAQSGMYDTPPTTHVFEQTSTGLLQETATVSYPEGLWRDGAYYVGQEAALDDGVILTGNSFGYDTLNVRAMTFAERHGNVWNAQIPEFDRFSPEARTYRLGQRSVSRTVAFADGIALGGDSAGRASNNGRGVVHFYSQAAGSQWEWGGMIVADDPQATSEFGSAVAFDGQTAVVTDRDLRGQNRAIYFFDRTPTGDWDQTDKLSFDSFDTPSWWANQTPWSAFSETRPFLAAVEGDTAVIRTISQGTILLTKSIDPASGSSTWEATQAWEDAYLLGSRTVAMEDDVMALSVTTPPDQSNEIHLYRRDATGTWTQFDTLTSPDEDYNNTFGASLALDNGRLLVGAASNLLQTGGPSDLPGAAFLFVVVPEPSPAILLAFVAIACFARVRSCCRTLRRDGQDPSATCELPNDDATHRGLPRRRTVLRWNRMRGNYCQALKHQFGRFAQITGSSLVPELSRDATRTPHPQSSRSPRTGGNPVQLLP